MCNHTLDGFSRTNLFTCLLDRKKTFLVLPWTTALQTKPANNSYTTPEIQKSCKRAQYSGIVKDEVPGRGEGCPAHTCSALLTSPRPQLPRAGERAGSCAHAPPWHCHTWAAPEERCQGPPRPQLLTRREIKVSRGREHRQTPATGTAPRTRAPRHRRRKPPCATQGKETLRKRFDWNITVNRREN